MEVSTKTKIRSKLLKQRRALSEQTKEEYAMLCARRLFELAAFQKAKTVCVYMSYNGELDTKEIIKEARRQGKTVAAPKVQGRQMEFYTFESEEEMERDRHGILEPVPNENNKVDDEQALLIMPGVAFDEQRNRIGYGGGFYDRYIQTHPTMKKIAVAYDFQIVEHVPADFFDQKPDTIVTDKRVISC